MTEVSTQTISQPAATVSTPASPATPAASATPAADTTPSNNSNTTATLETRPVTGWGGDEIKTEQDLNRAIELLDDDGSPLDTGGAPANAPAPAAAVQTPVATAPAPAPAKVEGGDDDGDGLVVPGSRPRHYKVPISDDVTFHALRLKKQAELNNTPLSLGKAEEMARELLGLGAVAPAPATTVPGEAAQTPATSVATVAAVPTEISGKLEAAYQAYQEARMQLDEEAEAKALREINDLNRQQTLIELRQQEVQIRQQDEAGQQFAQQWEASVKQGAAIYPDAANPQSALAIKAAELQELYGASQDPAQQAIYQSPTSPLFFYQQAAAALGVAPIVAQAPAAVLNPASPPQPAIVPQRPPVSALLSSPTGTTTLAAPAFDPMSIRSIHQLEELVEGMG